MKFFSDIRLLILAIWLGAAVFFIFVAQSAFAVMPEQRELAGAVVNRTLFLINYGGIGASLLLLLTSLVRSRTANSLWLWVERFLLLLVGGACAVGQFVLGFWLSSVRSQMGRSIDEFAVDDPLRVQFNTLHQYSEWMLLTAMIAALIAFFIIANRKFGVVKKDDAGVYDFSKEFKA